MQGVRPVLMLARALPALLATTLMLATASVARAEPLRPTAQAWATAEHVLRAEYDSDGITVVDVAPQRDHAIGTIFWVRSGDGAAVTGALVAVRGGHVLAGSGPTLLAAILHADDAVRTHTWAAADLLYLCTTLGAPPPLARSAITAVEQPRVLLPTIGYGRDAATLVVYCYRDGPPEDPAHHSYYVQRATGSLDEHGVITWTVADVVLDMRGHERLLPGTPRPTVYDACAHCAASGASCDACTSRSCRTCLERSLVLTDPSFCLPRCR